MTTTSRIDGLEASLAIKAPVRVATTANIALSGLQTIDGVLLLEDNRVLVCNQTNGAQNGIYIATTGEWSRAADWNGARDATKGTRIFVTDGATNGNKIFYVTTNNPIVIGTTAVVFAAEDTSGFDAISPITQLGDVIYGGAGGTSQRLAGNAATTRKFLSQTGDGSNSAAPSWEGLVTSDLPTVPITKGGTGETVKAAAFDALAPSTTKGDIIVHNGTDNVRLPSGADGAILVADSSSSTGLAWDTVAGGSSVFDDSAFRIQDNGDASKRIAFELSGISTGTTRTLTPPNANDTIVGATATQTLTNKTLTAPIISTISNSGTITLPTSTDTLVGRATTDTLTNKTLISPTITGGTVNATVLQVGGVDVLTAASIELDDLNDVDTTGATVHGANYTLEYSSVSGGYTLDTVTGSGETNTASNVGSGGVGIFKQKTGTDLEFRQLVAGSNITISGGTNEITITGAASGTGGGGASALDDLSDVTVSSPATGQLLRYNGTAWVNEAVSSSGIYINVKDFGVIGDGVADDTATIQSLCNTVASSGGILFFPKGNYRITSQITITAVNGSTQPKSTQRIGFKGESVGLTWFLWDGANTPNTYMIVVQSTDTTDSNNTHALVDFSDFSVSTFDGKWYNASGFRFIRRAFMKMSRVHFRRLHTGLQLDDVISSTFDSLVMRFNNHACRNYGAANAASDAVAVPFDNNAQTWINCIIAANNLTGMDFRRGCINFFGGTIEFNGSLNSAGNGYGFRIEAEGNTAPCTCNFYGTYLEQNGTTGNAGVNASVADILIEHTNTLDNNSYSFHGCSFVRTASNYAPHAILIRKSIAQVCNLNIYGCNFMDQNGYSPSSSRRYIGFQGSQPTINMNITAIGNYYNQPTELPLFLIDNGATIFQKNSVDFVRVKNYAALVLKSGSQTVASASDVAMSWGFIQLNDGPMFNAGSPTRLTVPNGVKRVRLVGNVRCFVGSVTNVLLQLFMRKNGSAFNGAPFQTSIASGGPYNHSLCVTSPVIPVTAGDYFELFVRQNTGSNITVLQDSSTYFSMEVVE